MIAAPKSGSGKTMVTCALLQALKEEGRRVVSFKCGPDYIDPMFHETVLGVPCRNLDTFFTGEKETQALFLRERKEGELAVLEGVMGLFDGLGGVRKEGSSYHLAQVTKTPILLTVDARGMGRSLIPLIAGFLSYDREHLIRGILLNRMGRSSYETLKPLLERELSVPVLGCLPEKKELRMESRHLGLILPGELSDLKKQMKEAAAALRETVCLEEILALAQSAGELSEPSACVHPALSDRRPVIAVARDEAFCFYYEDNLRLLREYGAKLRFFSPLHDSALPADACGLLLGGGYPELYARVLSENRSMLASVREAFGRRMPVVAECGGFLYLHETLTDEAGNAWPMAGVIPASCSKRDRLVRFGYVELSEKRSRFLPEGTRIRGHEFHYYDSSDNGADCLAAKPVTGRSWPCVHEGDSFWLGFPHLYYPSNPAFAGRFVKMAERFCGSQKKRKTAGPFLDKTEGLCDTKTDSGCEHT